VERQQVKPLLTLEEKQKLVQRALESEAFRRAPAMRAFLLYITDQAEMGRADQLKEQTIGVEVLGRKQDYDPARDNIVRVRAHELRGRLGRYFASEGAHEPVIITIPKGGYAPEFLPRNTVLPETTAEPPQAETSSGAGNVTQARFWWIVALAAMLVAVSSYIVITTYGFRGRSQAAVTPPTRAVRDFWTQFFAKPNSELRVVYADSGIALWQRLSDTDLNLGDYLSHKYLDSRKNTDDLLEVVSQSATSPADINTSLRLQAVAAELGGQVNAQFARSVNADFLHRGNLVLIGSRRSNPWVEVYEPSLNFQLRLDPSTRSPFFVNRSPLPHESATYGIPSMQDGAVGQFIQRTETKEFISYGVVALLKGCGTSRLTLLLEGLNQQATQAAGDLVTDPQLLERLLKGIGHAPGSNLAPFEALFQVTSLPGGYDNPKVVAYRLAGAESCVGD
jgi:hypothetical protein